MALDVVFCNYDRTAASPNVLATPDGGVWLIDHAACLVCDERLPDRPLSLPPHHILKSEESALVDPATMRKNFVDALKRAVATGKALPEVHIRGDKGVRFEAIGRVILACQQAGIQKVGFITEPHSLEANSY